MSKRSDELRTRMNEFNIEVAKITASIDIRLTTNSPEEIRHLKKQVKDYMFLQHKAINYLAGYIDGVAEGIPDAILLFMEEYKKSGPVRQTLEIPVDRAPQKDPSVLKEAEKNTPQEPQDRGQIGDKK